MTAGVPEIATLAAAPAPAGPAGSAQLAVGCTHPGVAPGGRTSADPMPGRAARPSVVPLDVAPAHALAPAHAEHGNPAPASPWPANPAAGPALVTALGAKAAPVAAILREIEAGAASVPDLAIRTGLAPDLVRAVVDRLIRTGRVRRWVVSVECAPTGCRDCAAGCPLSALA